MLVSFFESAKYVGHLVPMAFLRIGLGYFYLEAAFENYHGGFLEHPQLAANLAEWIPKSEAPLWYKDFLEIAVVSQWQAFATVITLFQFLTGFSFLFGFLVRPFSLVAIFFSCNVILIVDSPLLELHKLLLALNFTLGWLGAGRCLGADYYFFKKKRGIWW